MIPLLAVLLADVPMVAARAAPPDRPHIQALRTSTPPRVDGRLDDPAWQLAIASSAFTQHFPDEGAPPTERTEVRVLYDDDSLYLGVDCRQERSPIVRQLGRRDAIPPSDGISVDIDSRRDGTSAFHFEVNAAGVQADALRFNDTEMSRDWDAVWDARVADSGRGYSVEIRIPLHVLRFRDLAVQDWGFEVERSIAARQEIDHWAFYPRAAADIIPRFGRIDQLSDLRPRRAVQLRPFVVGRVRRSTGTVDDAGSTSAARDAEMSAGLDAQVPVTSDLTLNLTANPDFGQVEADTVVLNLSTYETFLQEKRPFFLERLDLFSSMRSLVYTRRIGAVPPAPWLAATESLKEPAGPAPILGAAKLTGTVGERATVGLLSAVTGQTDADVIVTDPATGLGAVARRLASPLTLFNVLRLRRVVGARGEIGLLATATDRVEPSRAPGAPCPTTGLAPAPDGRCLNDAYVTGVDGRWRSPSGDYAAAGQAIVTMLASGPSRPERDGIPIAPSVPAGGGSLYLGKEGGAHWLWSSWNHLSGAGLELNDLGYLERKNDYHGLASLSYRTLGPWWRTVETRTSASAAVRQTLDGLNLARELAVNTSWTLDGFWTIACDLHYRGSHYDDREIGNGTALERASLFGAQLALTSDPRRRVVASLLATADRLSDGAHQDATAQATFRPFPQLELELSVMATHDQGEPRYIASGAGAPGGAAPGDALHLFGEQTATSAGAVLHVLYTLTPHLSFELASQAFLARVRYERFFQYQPAGPRQRIPLAALTPAAPPTSAPEYGLAVVNASAVLRWEYRLGSTLTLVYTRAQAPVVSSSGASLDLRPLLGGHAATDVLMLKASYWWA